MYYAGGRQIPLRHKFKERGDDLYETEDVAIAALVRAVDLPRVIYEPACGRGRIVNFLRDRGHAVYASDLIDYGHGVKGRKVVDFLALERLPSDVEACMTNPPYKIANRFVAHAIKLCPLVIMLLNITFLESEGRSEIIERSGLRSVLVFRNRLPMMHRDGWKGRKSQSTKCYAWFVWQRGWSRRPEVQRISWGA